VKYHLVEARAAGSSRKEMVEAMSIGLVVGGTIVIPHLRRAVEFLDDLDGPGAAAAPA
jgi:alkylhydroperoxidase/carboxymuconolactone decarboxylase family protein YurZ